MIISFPIPKPDECLYSLVIRFHLLSGNRNFDYSAKELINAGISSISSPIPLRLGQLANKIASVSSLQAADLIEDLTLYPFFRTFIDTEAAERVSAIMMGNGTDSGKVPGLLGLPRKTPRVRGPMRYCPHCASKDFVSFGYTYWRRSHQLPGVTVCHAHGVRLVMRDDCALIWRSAVLPPTDSREPSTLFDNPVSFDNSPEMKYAWWCHHLLHSKKATDAPGLLTSVYRARLIERGYLLGRGAIDIKRLQADFIEVYGADFLTSLRAGLSPFNPAQSWLARLIRKSEKRRSPVHHVLLICFLFDSVDDFQLACSRAVNSIEEIANNEILKQEAIKLLQAGNSQIKILEQLPIKRSILRSIAEDMNNSIDSAHKQKMEIKWRTKVLETLRDNPQMSRKGLWINTGTQHAMRWLSENDKKWLDKTIPTRQKRAIDVELKQKEELDIELATRVPDVVSRLKSSPGLPIKITLAAIGKELGIPVFHKRLNYLPDTSDAIQAYIDSKETLDRRRLEWAIETIIQKGLKFNLKNIYEMARLNNGQASKSVLMLARERVRTG